LKTEFIFRSKILVIEQTSSKFAAFNIQAVGFIYHSSKERLEINPRSGELGVIHGTT